MRHNYQNNKGKIINDLINRNIVRFLGPDFPTLVARNGKLDIINANREASLNITIKPGHITSSDHIPIQVTLSTNNKRYKYEI